MNVAQQKTMRFLLEKQMLTSDKTQLVLSWWQEGSPCFTPTVHSECSWLRAEGTSGYQTSLSSAPFWSGVIDQPSVTTVTAASKPPSYRGAEDGYDGAIFSRKRRLIVQRGAWAGVSILTGPAAILYSW